MKMIKNKEDVYLLVNIFYKKIKKDPLLGPIFKKNIHPNEWDNHIKKLTDFWVTCLFGIAEYKGNPVKKHLKVDNSIDNQLDQKHFGRWLYLWYTTIDSIYNCPLSQRAKYMARNIASTQQMIILNNRNKTKNNV